MTLLKIAQMGHPILLAEALPVDAPDSEDMACLVRDMIETMEDARGVGLAAPQVYRSARLIVAKRADLGELIEEVPPLVLINPQFEVLEKDLERDLEGCLSIPGLRGVVPRYRKIGYSGLDQNGKRVEGEATGLFSRIIQHEIDHLDGVLYPCRLVDWSDLGCERESAHLLRR